jgi:hypothetical protein
MNGALICWDPQALHVRWLAKVNHLCVHNREHYVYPLPYPEHSETIIGKWRNNR